VLAVMAFVLAWALREPSYVWSFKKHLKKLGSPTSQGVFSALRPVLKVPAPPAKDRFTPQLSKLRPTWIISTWTVSVLTQHVVPAIQEYLMPAKGSPTASGLARLSTILRRKKLRFLATNYTTEHLIRTALLATKTTEPGVEFVKMGSSCQNVHFNKLKRMGLRNVADIMGLLPADLGKLTPRLLCYFICMGGLIPMKKPKRKPQCGVKKRKRK
jgi:hypothetical protein